MNNINPKWKQYLPAFGTTLGTTLNSLTNTMNNRVNTLPRYVAGDVSGGRWLSPQASVRDNLAQREYNDRLLANINAMWSPNYNTQNVFDDMVKIAQQRANQEPLAMYNQQLEKANDELGLEEQYLKLLELLKR